MKSRHPAKEKVTVEVLPKDEPPEIFISASVFDAQALYMNQMPILQIVQETGIARTTLQRYIYGKGGWKEQRDELQKDVNDTIKFHSINAMRKAVGISLHLIINSLEHIAKTCAETGEPPDLEEAVAISGIFARLQRAKVMEGLDDEEKKKVGLTPNEVLKALGSDPYLKKAIAYHGAQPEMEDSETEGGADDFGENDNSDSLARPQ